MLVLRSTHEQMKAEAKAAGKALTEMVGELTEGLKSLGLNPEPKPGETTAAMVVRHIKAQMIAVEQFREEVAETRATLTDTNSRLNRFTGPRQRGAHGRFKKTGDGGTQVIKPANGDGGSNGISPKANGAAGQGAAAHG